MPVAPGDRIPEATVTVMSKDGPVRRSTVELLGVGRVVLFAVPGPFTPTCSASHLPGFLEHAQALGQARVNRIVCMALQDIFVMEAWASASGVDGRVTMAADGNGEFTRALGLEMDSRAFGMGFRCQRFAMVIEDGVIRHLMVDAPGQFRESSAEHVLSVLG